MVCTVVLTILWGMVINYYWDYLHTPSHELIGNKPTAVNALKETGLPFSFLVVADTHNSGILENLIPSALRKVTPSFIVINGDIVRRPDIWHHRFFLVEIAGEIKPSCPVFLTVGNHDIDYPPTMKIKREDLRVTPEIYESLYGAMNLDFVFNNCLFIMCGFDPQNPTAYLSYLRNVLSQKGANRTHIFVFIHSPPPELAKHLNAFLPCGKEFFSLLESYRVTTCFFGHHHGYWRGAKNGVNYIVSGGGGGALKPDGFHHLLRITVTPDKIAEEIITTQEINKLENWFEEWVFTHIFPVFQNSIWLLYLIFVILLIISVRLLLSVVRNYKHRDR